MYNTSTRNLYNPASSRNCIFSELKSRALVFSYCGAVSWNSSNLQPSARQLFQRTSRTHEIVLL